LAVLVAATWLWSDDNEGRTNDATVVALAVPCPATLSTMHEHLKAL
jgi:predicted dinucleotide-binding enzyme